MFERYISDVLTSYFGQYIQDIDIETIRISAWRGGAIVLRDVQLRRDCLQQLLQQQQQRKHHDSSKDDDDENDEVPCPVEMIYGHIGRLELRIPWKVVRNQLLLSSSSTTTSTTTTTTTQNQKKSVVTSNTSTDSENHISIRLCNVNIILAPVQSPPTQQQHHTSSKRRPRVVPSSTPASTIHPTMTHHNVKHDDDDDDDALDRTNQNLQHEQSIQAALDAELLQRIATSTTAAATTTTTSGITAPDSNTDPVATSSSATTKSSWKQRFLERFQAIFANLAVSVQNIHIRYEDPGYGFRSMTVSLPHQYEEEEDDDDDNNSTSHNNSVPSPHHHFYYNNNIGVLSSPYRNVTNVHSIPEETSHPHHHHHHPYRQYRPSLAMGVTLREFTVQQSSVVTQIATITTTTTALQSPKVVLAAAHDVAVYWDSDTVLVTTSTDASLNAWSEAFQRLNAIGTEHSYVLDPFSPWIEFGLVPSRFTTTTLRQDNSESGMITNTCNTMDITFPPCRWNISKHLLDDIKYLRTSLSKWQNQQRLLQPDRHVRHILHPIQHLRPKPRRNSSTTTSFDSHQWWQYSYAAVTLLIQHDAPSRTIHTAATNTSHPQIMIRRPRGWIGLAQALGRRNTYCTLFLNFLRHHDDIRGKMEHYHQELQTLECTLLVDEVKSFRIATYEQIHKADQDRKLWTWVQSLITEQDSDDSSHGGTEPTIVLDDVTKTLLSAEHRMHMFIEMAAALHRERMNIEVQAKQREKLEMMAIDVTRGNTTTLPDQEKRLLAWKISLKCVEFSLQVNDTKDLFGKKNQRYGKDNPVVRLSCAFSQTQDLFQCGSWNMTTRIGSLFVKDCTVVSTTDDVDFQSKQFPNLVAMKYSENAKEIQTNDTFDIDGEVHIQNIWVEIKRVKWQVREEILRSRTETNVRVLPLEIVYSTAPVESLSHIFGTTNDDFSEDYNRIVNRLSMWKNRQQKRLLNALAHKQKQISFDIMIGAPVVLVPVERRLSDTLIIFDLGQLHFCSEGVNEGRSEYDDQWLLEMANVQIKSMPGTTYFNPSLTEETPRYVIEPFSLKFDIFTKVQHCTSESIDEESSVLAIANLPRLALNVNSTDVFQLLQLQSQWAKRKEERRPYHSHENNSAHQTGERGRNGQNEGRDLVQENAGRRLEFRFVAPIFTVRFETKSNRLDTGVVYRYIPLFDFALKGIGGSIVRKVSSQSINTAFCSKVQGLIAIDLFQTAGIEYSILLSSINPEILQGISSVNSFSDKYLSGDHLVSFDYLSKFDLRYDAGVEQGTTTPNEESNRLKVNFHELFVEWNPETIAMVSMALWAPKGESNGSMNVPEVGTDDTQKGSIQASQVDDEFFDAEEDAFYDAESVISGEDASRLLSEISESERSSISDFNSIIGVGSFSPWPGSKLPLPVLARPTLPGSPWSLRNQKPLPKPNDSIIQSRSTPFVVMFELTKLRVNFNKESRHRRLVTAEMDGTKVRYTKMAAGGSKIVFGIGNLTFSDCESAHNNTLYREILGLKTDGSNTNEEQSSLLEMEMITKPRCRKFVTLDEISNDIATSVDLPVFVDMSKGQIYGFDNYFQATLSPMRFVYLQQLWFEIVDYFFTAIVGYEVWGSTSPIPGDTTMLDGKSIEPDAVPFTRFDIVLKSPTILFPVSPCSTDFFRITASFISLRNWYLFDTFRPPVLYFRLDGENRQWFNNCDIMIEEIEICTWSGSVLNPGERRPSSKLSLSWPVGPSAPVNVPKWNVVCDLDETNFILDRVDYALLQHVIQHNLGSVSLHMEEWNLFQQLDVKTRDRLNEKILVHFPYDKKDSTPSTFDMTLSVSKISAVLTQGKGQDIAIVRCTNLQWKYYKLLDRLSRQMVTCNVDIIDSILGRALLSSDEYGKVENVGTLPKMEYSSCSAPSLQSEKTLLITSACIDIILQSWMSLRAFFQDLPLPAYLAPNEAIQVGDRWYKIGDQPTRNVTDEKLERLNWICKLGPVSTREIEVSRTMTSMTNTFQISLINVAVQVRSGFSALILSIEKFDFLQHASCKSTITRTFKLVGVEFQTRQSKVRRTSDFSLIRPWNVEAIMSNCQGTNLCACELHSCTVNADVLYARTAFSDIIVALDACMNLLRDIKASNAQLFNGTRSDGESQSIGSKSGKPTAACDVTSTLNQHISVSWEGVNFVLVDDSGRHFLEDQNLAHVNSQLIYFNWRNNSKSEFCSHCEIQSAAPMDLSMHLQVLGFNVTDCLQSDASPFREVISVMPQSSTTNNSPTTNLDDNHETQSCLEIWSKTRGSKSYGIVCPDISIQYNPSFVIALQRFAGRLIKEVKRKHGDFFQDLMHAVANKGADTNLPTMASSSAPYKLSVSIPSISVMLNKEHQNRRLLKTAISGVLLEFNFCATYSIVKGHISVFSATDPKGHGLTEVVIRSTTAESRFIEFVYVVFFSHKSEEALYNDIPLWVHSKLLNEATIDDMLDVSIGSHDIVYIKERTAELLDYLSNGMPGKGMGATSRAAKGFVDRRILRRTYANIQIGIPCVLIPAGQGNELYVEVKLGKFLNCMFTIFASLSHQHVFKGMLTLRSWIVAHENAVQSRLIKVLLHGFSTSLKKETTDSEIFVDRPLMDDLDFQVDVEISDTFTTVSCALSTMVIRLSYLDYLSLKNIVRHNLGKTSDRQQWDNLERAWAKELDETNVQDEFNLNSMEVAYSSSARVIRYGHAKGEEKKSSPMKANIKLGSIGLVLRRDDSTQIVGSSYDMIGIRGEGFECDLGIREDGEHWLHLLLSKMFVVDLGRMGRGLRCRRATPTDIQGTEAQRILVAGYNSIESHKSDGSEIVDSQLVFKAEREISTGNINAVIVISFISVTAFVEPIHDLISFVTCKWNDALATETISIKENPNVAGSGKAHWMSIIHSKFSLRFVSHYARFIFAADELDYQSRCLIIQG